MASHDQPTSIFRRALVCAFVLLGCFFLLLLSRGGAGHDTGDGASFCDISSAKTAAAFRTSHPQPHLVASRPVSSVLGVLFFVLFFPTCFMRVRVRAELFLLGCAGVVGSPHVSVV